LRFACWVTNATDTPQNMLTYCSSTAKTVKRTRLIFTLYVQCPSYLY